MNNPKYKNIYVIAPYNFATGGVELAHQLVHELRELGQNAYICYVDGRQISPRQDVTAAYKDYNIKTTGVIEDRSSNILVLPEVYYDFAYIYRNINIGCWWMSVDNHFVAANWKDIKFFPGSIFQKLNLLRWSLRSKYINRLSYLYADSDRISHYYQSRYAQYFLYNTGARNVMPLSDYINTSFATSTEHNISKEDIIVYNPKKGQQFTKQIIARNPDLEFVPIQGLDREGVQNLLRKAKLYIDFGNFPGKDRLPREAVLNDCCIITGNNGAAYFYEDLPIKSKYKIDSRISNLERISTAIRTVLKDYSNAKRDFSCYKQQVLTEQASFKKEVTDIFL